MKEIVGDFMLNYAENIKMLRKRKNYTQAELAKGITSQGMISKIEKKQISPDIDLLDALSKKLECSIMDLLSGNTKNDLEQVFSYMNNLVSKRDYVLLEHFFRTDPIIKRIRQVNEPYYKWIKSIILTQNDRNYEEGINEMLSALNLSTDNQLTVRILIGLSGVYSEIKMFNESLQYLVQATTLSEKLEVSDNLRQKLNFQFARVYSVLEKFNDSIFYNRLAIQFAVEQENLYLLDDLYLLLADSYLKTDQLDNALKYVKLAMAVAEVRNNFQLTPYIELTQAQIKEKMS